MITEDYCSYEVSELLKEKGFDEKVSTHYLIHPSGFSEFFDKKDEFPEPEDVWLKCPTHQMVLKWLREVHNIFIEISLSCDREDKNAKIFDASIFNVQNQRYKKLSNIQGYEEAVEAALKYCLENLI